MNTGEVRSGSLLPGKWHAVRIAVRGQSVKVLLDGKVATEGTQEKVAVVCASATKSRDGRVLYRKIVNCGPASVGAMLDLGAVRPHGSAKVWELSGADPEATNTAAEPERVRPRSMTWADVAARGARTLAPWSLTAIEVPLTEAPAPSKEFPLDHSPSKQ